MLSFEGGGFYYGFLKNPADRAAVNNILETFKVCDIFMNKSLKT